MVDYDVVIVGGGLAGMCLALTLKPTGMRVALIEAENRERLLASPAGDRALALAYGTVVELNRLDCWQGVAEHACAISHIHISDRGHFGKTRLSARHEQVPALGYVLTARALESHIAGKVTEANITVLSPARVVGVMAGRDAINITLKDNCDNQHLSAQVLVAADGGQSSVRQLLDIPQKSVDYQQTALVTTVKPSLPHHNTAYERFTPQGPLALLPMRNNQCAVVWTRSHEQANALMMGGEADFLAELQACFGYRLGLLKLKAPRRAFPLALIRAERMVDNRCVLIGNAAHQLHPVAGQGFNLGLRDVSQLAQHLTQGFRQQQDLGGHALLTAYANARQHDHDQVIRFTDSVVKIFSHDFLPLAAARNMGLALLDLLPGAKSVLAKKAMGYLD